MSVLCGKTSLITGASGGIGLALAETFASAGSNLVLVYRNEKKLKNFHKLLEKYSDQILIDFVKCDLSSGEDIQELISSMEEKRVDVLVNNAGIFPIKNISNSTLSDYEECFNVNVKAPFLLSKFLGSKMIDKKWGRIVNIGSSSSYNGSEDTGLYCASKHALLGLTRSLYKEYKKHNVRVYCVSPGSAQTDMGKTDTRQDFSTFITPKEIAEYITFMISFDGEGISEEVRINRMVIR